MPTSFITLHTPVKEISDRRRNVLTIDTVVWEKAAEEAKTF